MEPRTEPEPLSVVETLQQTIEDYERRFRLVDSQMRVLEKERQKLSAVVNNTDAGFLVIRADLRLAWANGILPGLLNTRSHAALLGEPCNKVVCRSDAICEICPASQALRSGLVAHHEVRLEIEDETRYIYVTSIPIKSPDGSVEETFVMLQDVSDLEVLRRSQEALRSSEERFRSIFEKAAAGMATVAPDGSFLQVNAALCRFLGYSESELLGMRVADVTHPGDRQQTMQILTDGVSKRMDGVDIEKRYARKDGSVVWGRTTATWLFDAHGSPLFSVALVQDITERKQAEDALRREKSLVQLQQEVAVAANEATNVEEAMRTGLDRVCAHTGWPVGHVYLMQEGGDGLLFSTSLWHLESPERFDTFRRVTEATTMSRGIGLPGRVLASRTPAWIADMSEDPDCPRSRAATDIGVKGGFGVPVMVGREVAAVLEFFYPEAAVPDERLLEVMRHIGTQLGRVIERERAGRALRHSEEQFRHAQKMEAVGRLAGGVAHDFNNLLTIITGHSELLVARHGNDDDLARELQEIKRAAARAAALTRQLLAFSRKQVLQPRVIDLNAAVADMDTMIRRLIGEDVRFSADLCPDLGRVKADRGQIEQVIMNLVVNARDAMPGGGALILQTAEVDLEEIYDGQRTLVEPGRYVMLAVRDTGLGMDGETQSHIFEPFFTTKEQGKGTGLGLSTVYGIVRQSGGYILVESEPGQGATFKIYLPRVDGAAPSVETRAAAPVTLTGSETVLLVEDELVVRQLTHEILRRGGYNVLEARDPTDARLICERYQGRIHLMLTDVVMPMMSGIELADYLRPMRRDMKVLFMSGYTDENLVSTAFIQKPFTPDGLTGKVREVLDTPAGL